MNSSIGGRNFGKYPIIDHKINFYFSPCDEPSIYLSASGYSFWCKGTSRWRKNSPLYSIEFVLEGIFEFSQDGEKGDAEPGDVFLVRKTSDSKMVCKSEKAKKWTAIIAGPLLPTLFSFLNLSDVNIIKMRKNELFNALIRDVESGEDFTDGFRLWCMKLLFLLSDEIRVNVLPPKINLIQNYINSHLASPLSPAELCQKFNMSRAPLFRLFKQFLHSTPAKVVREKRMETAKFLLIRDNIPIKDVAFSLGYRNQLYFSTEFKRFFGVSPKNFRRQYTSPQ